jgi:glycosyltransferase involved in cell wall biosynthesis
VPRIAIVSVINDLVTDNRVHKTCLCLEELGYKVILIGRKLPNSPIVNRSYKTIRLKLLFRKKVFFYAEFNLRLFLYLLFHKSDILLANDLDTLLPNYIISKFKRIPLLYDSHEYFTEVPELIGRNFIKKIWLIIEKFIVPKLKLAITVNESLAKIYTEKYKIPFFAVRNVPFLTDKNYNSTTKNKAKLTLPFKYILLYQGSLNIGRGIEKLILSLKYLDNSFGILIIGSGDIEQKLHNLVKKENLDDRVYFLGKINLEDLPIYTRQAHFGFSLEESMGLNYYYALPNKLFDYIHAEVPVICSALPEMKNIVDKYEIGLSVNIHDEKHLADIISFAINNTEQYNKWKINCIKAKNELCWEKEKEKLKEVINLLINN